MLRPEHSSARAPLDPVAALIVDEAALARGAAVLVVDDRAGALAASLLDAGHDVRAVCDDVRDERALPVGVRVLDSLDAGLAGVDVALLRLPKSLGALEEYAQALAASGVPRVVAGGRVKHMTRTQNEVLGRPLLVCAAVSAAFGLVTLWLAGWTVLAWVPVYACLLVPALWLASRRRERATIGGLLTTAAASLLVLVVGWTSPLGLPWGSPLVTDAAACAALVFGYFGGTVLYVKSNIRERGNAQFARVSVGWHVAWLAIAALGWASGWASAWWAAFFAVTVARAWAVPRRRPGLRPMQLGLIEIALCVVLLVALGAVGV